MNSGPKSLLVISVGPRTALPPVLSTEAGRLAALRHPACAASCRKMRRAFSEQQRSKVGFPIRKFSDQSLFAAPRNLSQRTTSFIASQRQGIHQIPLWHLIALIAKARFDPPISAIGGTLSGAKRPVLLQTHPEILAVKLKPATGARRVGFKGDPNTWAVTSRPAQVCLAPSGPRPNALPLHDVRNRKAPDPKGPGRL